MFTVVKIREGLGRNDYKDPGWYKAPVGSVAYEWNGSTPLAQEPAAAAQPQARAVTPARATYRARKPSGHAGH
jgi:hypothetical protein